MRLTTRSIGLLIVLLGAWGGIVPYVGPKINYPFPAGSDTPAWHWSHLAWQLSLAPGIAVIVGGVMVLGLLRVARVASGLGALIALAAGTWFVVGDEFSRLWTSPPPQGTGSDWMVIATNLGYYEGTGLAIAALAALALGLLALLPKRSVAPSVGEHPVLAHEPERRYEQETAYQ